MNEEKDIKKDELDPQELSKIQSPIKSGLKTKESIVANWLPRYTGREIADFSPPRRRIKGRTGRLVSCRSAAARPARAPSG